MRYLLSAFLITFTIASCNVSSSEQEPPEKGFEPYTVGSFKIISPTEAEYIGLQGNQKVMAKSDSAVIDSLGDFQLTLRADTTSEEPKFTASFIDSAFTSMPDSIDHNNTSVQVYIPNYSGIYNGAGLRYGIGSEYSFMEAGFWFRGCNESELPESNLIIEYFESDSLENVYKKYLIKTNKLGTVIKDIVCS